MDVDAGNSSRFLEISHEPDGLDGVGLLRVTGGDGEFAGRSSAYFVDAELIDFAVRLADYPLLAGEAPRISGGESDLDGANYVERVGLQVQPHGPLGRILVRVHLTKPDPTQAEAGQEVRFVLLTTYERLRVFSLDLEAVMKGDAQGARLEGEP